MNKAVRFFVKSYSYNAFGVPEKSRTSDLSLRRRSLYPTELREQEKIIMLKMSNKNELLT